MEQNERPTPESTPPSAATQEPLLERAPKSEQGCPSEKEQPNESTKKGSTDQPQLNKPRTRLSRVVWQFVIPAITGTITLIVITLQSVIYFSQLQEMRKSNEASIKAAAAAEKAATATEDSVRVEGQIADRDQRAWLTIGDCVLQKPLAVNEKPSVMIKMTNSGRTPALDVDITARVIVTDQISEDRLVRTPSGKDVSKSVLGPSASATSSFTARELIKDQSEIYAIMAEHSCLVVSGFVTYSDIFRRNHRTNFCCKITGSALESGVMSSCAIGNTLE